MLGCNVEQEGKVCTIVAAVNSSVSKYVPGDEYVSNLGSPNTLH